jgi:cytochrome P450
MATDALATGRPAGECPVHRINTIPDLVQVVRSRSVHNDAAYFAAAHKLVDGHITVDGFVGGMWYFSDGEEHRRRRKLVNQLVRPDALDEMREQHILPSISRFMRRLLTGPDADGLYRCDLVQLADMLFVSFGARMIGFTDLTDERLDQLRGIVPGIFGGVLAQFFDNREAVFQMALAAKQQLVNDFYIPARDHYRELYRKVEAGELDESKVPRTLMRFIVSQSDPVYADEEIGIRDAILVFNTAIGTSVQAVVNMVHDVTRWFAAHPGDEHLSTDMDFLTRCMEETIRLKAPFISFVVRKAAEDMVVAGQDIRAGDELHLEIPRSNRDPAVFGEDADRFNPWRSQPEGLPRYGIGFGTGQHACLGLRVVLGNDGKTGSHVRFMQELFGAGVKPDPDADPQVMQMSQDESSMDDIPTFLTYPVVFTDWKPTGREEGV